ncbi:MAG TPA: sugar isomerase [Phycisphaerae bacterium]|nr:sugar isomerase [Phycisphaerae bacterium]
MTTHDDGCPHPTHSGCCGCTRESHETGFSRREFLKAGSLALGGVALAGCAEAVLRDAGAGVQMPPARKPLVVKPILMHDLPKPRPKSSWRSWGGVQTPEAAKEETARIAGELEKVRTGADFPLTVLPVSVIRGPADLGKMADLAGADTVIIYAAGGGSNSFDAIAKTGKHVIFFMRHKSGPVYLWYEIISPRYLRRHTDTLAVKGMDFDDVVVDSTDELAWRLRALCGLKNTLGARIIAIGGAGGWATREAPNLARDRFKLDIQTVSYPELSKLIQAARGDKTAVETARARAAAYLKAPGVSLETKKEYVENCFLLDQVFRAIMKQADAPAITVNSCMGTIMPIAETTACLTLSLLNDDGYLAFCESDFVVVPSGILLGNIAGRPVFLNDPTYPHDGVITLAHCTAPRRNDGRTLDPVRLVTHFESDYGAAPKVEMRKGQQVTNIIPDFKAERWVGYVGEIVDVPFMAICRSQIDVGHTFDDALLAERMPGFHWMTCYGDYRRELGYALKKIPIAWEQLG